MNIQRAPMDSTLLVLCEIPASQHLKMSIHANHVKGYTCSANPFTHCVTGLGPLEPSAVAVK